MDGLSWPSFIAGIIITLGIQGLAIALMVLWCHRYLYGKLVPTYPLTTSALIVEGWVPDRVIKQVAVLISQNHYTHIFIAGPPLHKGAFLTDYTTYAEVTASTLVKLGIDRDRLTVINCAHASHYRTHTAAQAIYDRIAAQNWDLPMINLCSAGAHARRSWLTYQRVFAPTTQVGIIGLPDGLYEPSAWWRSSAGARSLLGETIAYLHARWLQ